MIEYTVEVYDDGNKYWWLNGANYTERMVLLLKGLMAIRSWYLNGKLHREDGPCY